MSDAIPRSHIFPGTRSEQIRLRPATRNGRPVVQIDVLEPLATHTAALTVVGRPVIIPIEQVGALRDVLGRLAREEAEAPRRRTLRESRRRAPAPTASRFDGEF